MILPQQKENTQPDKPVDLRPRKERRPEILKQRKLITKVRKKLGIDEVQYEASESSITSYGAAKEVKDFLCVMNLEHIFTSTVQFNQRKSTYSPQLLSQLVIEQKILGIHRIENSVSLDADSGYLKLHGLDNYPDPETIRDHLEKYDPAKLVQLNSVNKQLLETIARIIGSRYITLHVDSTVLTVFGNQEQSAKGYNPRYKGRKSYCLKTCTIEELNLVLYIELCPGSDVSATDFSSFFTECMKTIPATWVVKEVKLDKGYYSESIIHTLEDSCLDYTIAAKQYAPLKRHIKDQLEVTFDDVESERYKVVETFFRPDTWAAPRRFIVARMLDSRKKKDAQGELFAELYYREQALVTNKESSPAAIHSEYNQRACCENIIKELQYGFAITKAPSMKYEANAAYTLLAAIGYNLINAMKLMVLPQHWKNKTVATLRKLFIQLPGRLVNRSGKAIMRLSERYRHVFELEQLQENILLLAMKFTI